jgi:hypothetical protein
MNSRRLKRWGILAVVGVLMLAAAGFFGFRLAVGMVRSKIVEALGPGSDIREIRVGWSSVSLVGLRVQGPPGWPAADALRADEVRVVPSLTSLLAGRIAVTSITVTRPYLSTLRTRDGRLRVVPSLLERPPDKDRAGISAPVPELHIGRITLTDGVVDFFDATVAQPPLRTRLEQIQAGLKDILVPALTGKTDFDLSGVVKGAKQDGRVRVSGWVEVATKDSSVKMELHGMDLVAFQPYLSRAADVRVQRGSLDVTVQSDVRKNTLKAPGSMSIARLDLAPGQGVLGTFMGMPRSAVLGFMKGKGDTITVHFVLEGDLTNPQFSLNEIISRRVAVSMAESLGVNIRGLAEGAGSLGFKGVGSLGETAKGLGGAMQKLFGGPKK